MEYHSDLKKEENPVIRDNMHEARGHYAKWSRQDTEGQIPPSYHLYQESKIVKSIDVETRMAVARGPVNGLIGRC